MPPPEMATLSTASPLSVAVPTAVVHATKLLARLSVATTSAVPLLSSLQAALLSDNVTVRAEVVVTAPVPAQPVNAPRNVTDVALLAL